MSYDKDLANAGKGWVDIQGKRDTDDVPDPITPHPFENAVTEMEKLLKRSWCYETKGLLMNTDKARAEFFKIRSSENITNFLEYWARFALRAKEIYVEADMISKNPPSISPGKPRGVLRTGKCAKKVLENMDVVKRYMAA